MPRESTFHQARPFPVATSLPPRLPPLPNSHQSGTQAAVPCSPPFTSAPLQWGLGPDGCGRSGGRSSPLSTASVGHTRGASGGLLRPAPSVPGLMLHMHLGPCFPSCESKSSSLLELETNPVGQAPRIHPDPGRPPWWGPVAGGLLTAPRDPPETLPARPLVRASAGSLPLASNCVRPGQALAENRRAGG